MQKVRNKDYLNIFLVKQYTLNSVNIIFAVFCLNQQSSPWVMILSDCQRWFRFENLSTEFPGIKDAYECNKTLFVTSKNSRFSFKQKLSYTDDF